MDSHVKRDYKNSVFIDMFAQENFRLQLFQTLHPEMTDVTADDIQAITLKQVIINHQYNDLAFLVKDRLMVFVEAQSTWSVNILIRVLLYLADTVQTYLQHHHIDIHQTRKLSIPKPEFYIIYTGKQKVPASISLRNDFFADEECHLELEAKVFSAETEDIIGQYIIFCRVLDDQVKRLGLVKDAAVEAIHICQNRGILVDYLQGREEEVIDIMIMLFDQEYAVDQYGWSRERKGKINSAIDIYRDEMGLDDATIIEKIRKKFDLSQSEAEEYVFSPAVA